MLTSSLTLVQAREAATNIQLFLQNVLGYDKEVKGKVKCFPDVVHIWCRGKDSFKGEHSWESYSNLTVVNYDEEWEPALAQHYKELSGAMRRDERELRHAIERMGEDVEQAAKYKTEYGRLIHQRMKAGLEEASGNLLTFQLGEGKLP